MKKAENIITFLSISILRMNRKIPIDSIRNKI